MDILFDKKATRDDYFGGNRLYTDPIFKYKRVQKATEPTPIKEKDIFEFPKGKKKSTKKVNIKHKK